VESPPAIAAFLHRIFREQAHDAASDAMHDMLDQAIAFTT
jgi:hypothetical protein